MKKTTKLNKNNINEFHHANLYYLCMIVSIVLFIFYIVQGIRYHVSDSPLTLTMSFYTMGVVLFVISVSCYKRGRGHYHYHGHL